MSSRPFHSPRPAAFLLLAGLLGGAAAAAAARAGDGPPPAADPAVRVETVGVLDRTQPKVFIGTVAGSETQTVVARVSGTLEKVSFREGGLVKKGDLLFSIEDTAYRARVAIAQARVKQVEAELALSERDFDRQDKLIKDDAIARSTHDSAFYKVALDKARLEEAKANLILAEDDLAHTEIRAKVGGRIGEKRFSEGNYVTPASGALATIVRFDPVHVKFPVSEADYFRFFRDHDTLGDAALDIVRANGETYRGRAAVDFVDNAVDGRTDTIMARLTCSNEGYPLLPGGYVQVRLARKFAGGERPAVNVQAVVNDAARRHVFVVGPDNTVERREVTLGEQVFRRQAVLSGLRPGERVVVGGLNKIRPGQRVNPVADDPPAGGPAAGGTPAE